MKLPHLALISMTVAASILAAGCEEEAPQSISREDFIEAYVQVRVHVLRSPAATIPDADRTGILAGVGVTEEEMEEFVVVHGEDVAYMRDVWAEIETRLDVDSLSLEDPISR